jgi:hypothetical protein
VEALSEAVPIRDVRTLRPRSAPRSPSVNQGTLLETPRSGRIEEPTFVPWNEFTAHVFDWEQGEHVTILAPTGWGKTTLGLAVLPKREYVLAIGTKPEDDTLDGLERDGYKVVRKLPLPPSRISPRVIFWPNIESPKDIPAQRAAIRDALMEVYHRGGFTVFIDELDYICNFLNLKPLVELLWRQGRSLGVSVVGGTQRPAFIPLLAYDQATHLFIGRDNDDRNVKRYASMAGIGKAGKRGVEVAVGTLPRHAFLYHNSRSGEGGLITTRVDA